jgi:hypothetical protein
MFFSINNLKRELLSITAHQSIQFCIKYEVIGSGNQLMMITKNQSDK